MRVSDEDTTMTSAIVAVIGALIAALWFRARQVSGRVTPIAPDDPIWVEAVARARATVQTLRQLHGEGQDVWVKFRFARHGSAAEHVWGRVLRVDADLLHCTIETPPIESSGPAETDVPLGELEDWQVQLEDGSIRGGFTTRAQARVGERDGTRVPRHIRDQIARMVD
jgi:hypothetical protein